MLDKNGYYSLRDIMGYSDCKYLIVLSDRGRGKTWAAMWFFLNQPGKTMCLTRQKPDMKHQMSSFLDTYAEGDEEHEAIDLARFNWLGSDETGWELEFDGETKFYFRTLSQVNAIKQEKFPKDLDWVWFDEFIPLVYKKLPGVPSEGDALRAIMKTIDHDSVRSRKERGLRPLRCLMYANPFTWDNTLLRYFKIQPREGIFRVGPEIVCEMLAPAEDKESHRVTTAEEFLGDEVHKNQGWMKQTSFVEPVKKGSVPYWSIRIKDLYFLIYRHQDGNFYVSQRKSHLEFKRTAGHGMYYATKLGTRQGLMKDETVLEDTTILNNLKRLMYTKTRFADVNCKFNYLNALSEL